MKLPGDHSFPQPADGMLGFNQSNPEVRKMFTSDCLNATRFVKFSLFYVYRVVRKMCDWLRSRAFNGCFIDRANWALDLYIKNDSHSLAGVSRYCKDQAQDPVGY